MTHTKVVATKQGGHVWVAVWVRTPPSETWQKSGDLCMDQPQWENFAHPLWQARGIDVEDNT